MQRPHKIRWRKSDYQDIGRIVKNVNAKISRVSKNHPELIELQPERLSKPQIVESIKTRKDLKEFYRKYGNYLKRGSEKQYTSPEGVKYSQWERAEYKRAKRLENIRRARERKRLGDTEITRGGIGVGYTRAESGKAVAFENMPVTRDIEKYKKREEFEKDFLMFEKHIGSTYYMERDERAMRNYIKGLIREGFPDELIKLVQQVPVDEFGRVLDSDKIAEFKFIYDMVQLQIRVEELTELWGKKAKDSYLSKMKNQNYPTKFTKFLKKADEYTFTELINVSNVEEFKKILPDTFSKMKDKDIEKLYLKFTKLINNKYDLDEIAEELENEYLS